MERNHKIKSNYGMQQYWQYYKGKKYRASTKKVDYTTYARILNRFLEAIRDEISINNKAYNLPYQLGTIEILKSKPEIKIDEDGNVTGLPVDFKATMELRKETGDNTKKVYHMNDHTNGYVLKVAYRKYFAKFKNKSIYSFNSNRVLDRNVNKAVRNGDIDIDFIPLIFKKRSYE